MGPQFDEVRLPSAGGRPMQNEPDFKKIHPSAQAQYMAYHLDPSGGVNHSPSFPSVEHVNKWLVEATHNGPAPVADQAGHSMLSGYEIHRRHNNSPDGSWTNWTSVGGGHIDAAPLAPGQKPHERAVTFDHLGHKFNSGIFQKKSAEQWQTTKNNLSRKPAK